MGQTHVVQLANQSVIFFLELFDLSLLDLILSCVGGFGNGRGLRLALRFDVV